MVEYPSCESRKYRIFVFTVSFPFSFNQDMEALFETKLEISLDCVRCLKKQRTIVVYPEKDA